MAAIFEIERRFFELFIQKDKTERFVERIGNPTKRYRIWDDLRDTRYLDARCLTEVVGGDKQSDAIGKRLRGLGFSRSVYVMSSDEEIDGTMASLAQTLDLLWGVQELLGFCQKSQIGFFKNHEHDFYVLQKIGC